MISDFALASQLHAFMDVIPMLWTWDSLQALLGQGETHWEQRGPVDNFLQFGVQVLEEGVENGDRYLHVMVSVTDPGRASGRRGSSKTPMATSFLFFANGKVDMPLAREIYERSL